MVLAGSESNLCEWARNRVREIDVRLAELKPLKKPNKRRHMKKYGKGRSNKKPYSPDISKFCQGDDDIRY